MSVSPETNKAISYQEWQVHHDRQLGVTEEEIVVMSEAELAQKSDAEKQTIHIIDSYHGTAIDETGFSYNTLFYMTVIRPSQ